ncbi:hypothetical protein SLS55_007631 [Diplodia seriata]|uniref:Uncharacterized protein n=1 Tax=Diplodia seriata TaxID=420778 RepID=A0ABR3C840_9PEZI
MGSPCNQYSQHSSTCRNSVPLHLAFNSVIFAEVQANNYMVMPVTDAFYTGGDYDTSGFTGASDSITQAVIGNASRIRERFQSNANATKRLDTSDCLNAYNKQYISRYGDVLLFQDKIDWHYLPFTADAKVFPSYGWVCPSRDITNCTLNSNSENFNKTSWAPYGSPVLYCLAELVKEQCKLQFSPWIATAVITYNAIKAFCMLFVLFSAAIIVAGISIHRTTVGMPKDAKGLWTTAFGGLKGNNLLGMSMSTIGAIILTNTPQLVLSYLYVCYNALYTCMFVQREFVQYSRARKPLRVTAPVGQQRSTYWLQLPYRYAVPLTGLSALLHWLASQSLFMVSITVFENYDDEKGIRRTQNAGRISTCGYSPVAIILTTCVGCIIAVGGLVLAARRYPPGVRLVSSCSAAISAACHPPMSAGEAALLPVQWGVVWESDESDQFGHVTLTSFPVTEPIEGKLYI